MSYQSFSIRSLPLLLVLSLGASPHLSNAFALLSGTPQPAALPLKLGSVRACTTHSKITGSALFAKKRIRKDAASSTDSGDLPDFDLDEDGNTEETNTKTKVASGGSETGNISANMMGSSNKPASSLRDLLNDRGLESKMQFEMTAEAESMPDLADLYKGSYTQAADVGDSDDSSGSGGKKRARQEARRAAAQAVEEKEEFDDAMWPVYLLEKLPFNMNLRNEKGEPSAIKLLEAATWAGIYSLVAWEVYINSPFFHRSAPLIPVVYDFLL
jgi:hypothetical protein